MRRISLDLFGLHADTGDCLLWKGDGIVARIIRQFSEYSHASLVVRLAECDGEVFLVEAVFPEVEFRDATARIQHQRGKVHLFRPRRLNPSMRACIAENAMEIVATGVRYDFESLIKNVLGRVSMDARAYFCSELVWSVWQRCGLAPDWATTAPRPGDIPRRVQGDLYEITI